jgi:thiamine-monophosphate kinase
MADRPSEFALIARYFAPLARDPGALALGDDAALLENYAGTQTVVTTDALVAGVHFLADDPPHLVAQKALRVNLSDLAAKGAAPAGYLLALSLPQDFDAAWVEDFAAGLQEDQQRFGVSLLGGDTTATPGPLTLAITALGRVPQGRMLQRRGARPDDLVFVSGSIGDAGAGLAVLQGKLKAAEHAQYLIGRTRLPTPRLDLGTALHGVATASLDVSDGLLADLGHIAEVSQVRITVESERVPLSPAFRATCGETPAAIVHAATAGDDYEIAFTAPSEAAAQEAGKHGGVAVSRIGRVEAGQGVALLGADGHEIPVARAGFSHF